MGPKLSLMMSTRLLAAAALVQLLLATTPAAGQQGSGSPASCTASLITSFTPCFSYLTNSSNGGATAPTRDCCQSLAALVNASAGCACLILTGAVPLGLGAVPVNRTLAVSLPKACNSMAVPLQCRDTSTQTPAAPGPVADAPSQITPPATPEPEAPAPPVVEPAATAPVSQGQTRPMVLPSSAARPSARVHVHDAAPAFLLLLAVGAALV